MCTHIQTHNTHTKGRKERKVTKKSFPKDKYAKYICIFISKQLSSILKLQPKCKQLSILLLADNKNEGYYKNQNFMNS